MCRETVPLELLEHIRIVYDVFGPYLDTTLQQFEIFTWVIYGGGNIMEQQQVSRTIVRKIQTLAETAAELRQGKFFRVTRLTLLKNLCNRREAATKFAVHLTELTLKKMQERECPSHITSENWEQYLQLAAKAAHEMTEHVNRGMTEEPWALHALRKEIRNAQGQYERQAWGPVRIIHSRELLFVETALECVLQPRAFQILAYDLTRQYCERRDARYGTGLLPESAPLVEDIAEFWGRYFLGRGWRNRLAT